MGWASHHIQRLQQGDTIKFRPRGNSMTGRVNSGQLVTVEPLLSTRQLVKGDIVLAKVKGKVYLHLISATSPDGRFQISNNKGHVNGWTPRSNIFGVLICVED